MIRIRPLTPADAERFLELLQAVDAESPYMLYEPGERKSTPDKERARINWWRMAGNSTVLGAEAKNLLVGFAMVTGGTVTRNRHCLTLEGLAVRKTWRRKGLGSKLLCAVLDWAVKQGLRRMELGVMAPNAEALALYEKHGFTREGVKRQAFLLGDRAVDQVLMARLLPAGGSAFLIDKEKNRELEPLEKSPGPEPQ